MTSPIDARGTGTRSAITWWCTRVDLDVVRGGPMRDVYRYQLCALCGVRAHRRTVAVELDAAATACVTMGE